MGERWGGEGRSENGEVGRAEGASVGWVAGGRVVMVMICCCQFKNYATARNWYRTRGKIAGHSSTQQ